MVKKTASILIWVLMLLMLCVPSFATSKRTVNSSADGKNVTQTTVSATETKYTFSMPIANTLTDKPLGVWYKSTGDTVDLNIIFEQSFRRPVTETEADLSYLYTHAINLSLTDELWNLATIDTVKGIYGRFKIRGQGSNATNTTLQIKVTK